MMLGGRIGAWAKSGHAYDTLVDWIRADGQNIIYTDILPTSNTVVVVDYVAENANSIFMTNPNPDPALLFRDGPTFGVTGSYNGNLKSFRFGTGTGITNNFTRWDERSTVEFGSIVKVNGVVVKVFEKSSFTYTSKFKIAIFGRSSDNGDKIIATLFSFKAYEDGLLIADFKPALKDGVAGLWDAVEDRMYYDLNGHPFTYG